MIRAAGAFALGVFLPGAALAYVIEFTDVPLEERPSAVTILELPASSLRPAHAEDGLAGRAGASRSVARPGHYLVDARSDESVGATALEVREKSDFPASRLAERTAEPGLSSRGLASVTRLEEVESGLRARTDELLSEFGAREENGEIVVSLPGDVLFDFDKSDIRPDAEPVLARIVELLSAFTTAPIMIAGHTDSMGSEEYNIGLSEGRAASVGAWLAARGIEPSRMAAEGYGEAEPIAPNTHPDGSDDPEGRQLNRRVEFTILKAED